MAHILSGPWTSHIVNSGGQLVPEGRNFNLVIDEASGTVDAANSSHGGANNPLKRGQARHRDKHRIELVNAGGTLYEGVLVTEETATQLVLCGYRRLNAEAPLPFDEREGADADQRERQSRATGDWTEEEKLLRSQEVLIWVATKP